MSAGKHSPNSPYAFALRLGMNVPGGEQHTWTSLLDPAVETYWRKRALTSGGSVSGKDPAPRNPTVGAA